MKKTKVFIPVVNRINNQFGVVIVNLEDKVRFNLSQQTMRIKNGYAFHRKLNKYIHRLITEDQYQIVDHVNKNKLDCTRLNLRQSNYQLNKANSKPHLNRRYKGVRKAWSKYRSTIVFNGKQIHLGMYMNALDAAKAYNVAAVKYYGDHSELNNV